MHQGFVVVDVDFLLFLVSFYPAFYPFLFVGLDNLLSYPLCLLSSGALYHGGGTSSLVSPPETKRPPVLTTNAPNLVLVVLKRRPGVSHPNSSNERRKLDGTGVRPRDHQHRDPGTPGGFRTVSCLTETLGRPTPSLQSFPDGPFASIDE